MVLELSNKIIIKDAPEELFAWCRKHLEFPNPEYAKKQNMGLWAGDEEPVIVLWEQRGSDIILPYGELYNVCKFFKFQLQGKILDYTNKNEAISVKYHSHINLFEYQKQAFESIINNRNGVIVMPCGSGKTQTALEIVAYRGVRTLWITHTYELLKQAEERAKNCFGLDYDSYGIITNGRINAGTGITFATVQTMCDMDFSEYKDYWDCIIVDECHKAIGTPKKLMMFYKVISSLNAKYKYGLTATPERNDGLERCMYALIGPQLCRIPDSAVAHNTVPINVWQVKSDIYNPDIDSITKVDGTLDYTKLISDLCNCEARNRDIASIVNSLNSTGKTCLVLSDRVEHLEVLRKLVGEDYTMQIYSMSGSKKARDIRRACIEQLKSKQIRCLFATYQLAKEGLDIPSLDCVIFTCPKKDKITVIQSCGRVSRKAEGKNCGYVIDYVDEQFSILKHYAQKRVSMYKSKKYFINFVKNTLLFSQDSI